jgi:hypothetical protein
MRPHFLALKSSFRLLAGVSCLVVLHGLIYGIVELLDDL